jgi:hypothetical protein
MSGSLMGDRSPQVLNNSSGFRSGLRIPDPKYARGSLSACAGILSIPFYRLPGCIVVAGTAEVAALGVAATVLWWAIWLAVGIFLAVPGVLLMGYLMPR